MNRPPNRLLSAYHRRPQYPPNHPAQRGNPNPLLRPPTHPMEVERMRRMQEAQRQRMKRAQELKRIELQQAEREMRDPKKLREVVIKPVEIDRSNEDVEPEYVERDRVYDSFKKKKEKAWEKRTNQPYKNVLKNVLSDADYKKKYQKKDDLIVHRVTRADKDRKKLLGEYDDFLDNLEKHDDDLRVIYSASKEAKHKKKFDYNNVYKYRVKEEPAKHDEMKESHIEAYKREQKRLEKGKKQKDQTIEELIDRGYLNDAEIEEIEAERQEEDGILRELGLDPSSPKSKKSGDSSREKSREKVREKPREKVQEKPRRKERSKKSSDVDVDRLLEGVL